jgi:hypothetical protein
MVIVPSTETVIPATTRATTCTSSSISTPGLTLDDRNEGTKSANNDLNWCRVRKVNINGTGSDAFGCPRLSTALGDSLYAYGC